MISSNFQDEVWNKLNSIERRLSFAGGGGYAPSDAEYVVMSLNGILTDERVLTAGVGLDLVDGGAGGNATLNVDVGIADDDIVQIDSAVVANNDYAKFTANGLEGRNYAEVLSDLSGEALAAFDWNGQNLTNIGTIGSGAITSSGTVVALALNAANLTLTTPGQISIDVNIDTAAVFMGTKLWYHKTAGATDHNDNFCGQYIVAEMDQAAGEISCLYGGLLYARLTAGNIGDASNARFLIGQLAVADLDGGKVWGDAYGLCATVDQGVGNEVTGNIYGLYSEVDADGTLGGLAYMLYLNEKSNVDYGIYQNGGALNVLGGALQLDTVADAGADVNKFLVLDAGDVVDYRTGAEVLADLSGDALAAFSWNSQNLTSTGRVHPTTNNSVFGLDAGIAITLGTFNTLIGWKAGNALNTGDFNNLIGGGAGFKLTDGNENNFQGRNAGLNVTTGSFNCAFGANAGRYQRDGATALETPERSVYVGYNSKSGSNPAGGEDAITNEIVIGYNAIGHGSNTTTLGSSSSIGLYTDAFVYLSTIKSGATQAGAGAAANELWKTNGHATLPNNVVMIGA